jgi:hypothetical protein
MKHGELTDAEYNQLEWVQTLIREALSTWPAMRRRGYEGDAVSSGRLLFYNTLQT